MIRCETITITSGSTGAGTAGVRVKVGTLTELTDSKTAGWVALRVYGQADAT